ncbi:hypothetical protein FACS1894130_05620 [Spirochaetia bacterium]|nr:hypothetical protein FACS1894130_05620 [Spirochaetia bacterium]
MLKRIITAVLFLFIVTPLFAPDEYVHNLDLMKIILGRPFPQSPLEEAKFALLAKASYLAIDQFNGHNLEYLNELREAGVKNLPPGNEINFTAGGEHQRYTHRGWDWINYPVNIRGYNFQQIWETRKTVLLLTLDRLFEFRNDEIIKRDSLGAIIYYTHALGDHWGDAKGSYMDRMPVSSRPDYRFNRSGPNANNPTICTELLYHIPRLFREQVNSIDYRMLLLYLNRRKSQEFPSGTTITDEEYAQVQIFARETLDTLGIYIPRLLKNENFYKKAFNEN